MSDPLAEASVRARPPLASALARGVAPWAVGLGLALVLQFAIGPVLPGYFAKILSDVGIAIVLGVSLNLVNGFTGQFSIGHAGFMAVGGYIAGTITYYGHYLLWGGPAKVGGFLGPSELLFVAAALAGGAGAAVAGYLVGLPSLRLRGDYLAIVTLGFGKILRVLLQRTNDVLFTSDDIARASWLDLATSVGGSLGFNGIPFLTNLFFVWVAVTAVLVMSYRLKQSDQGRGFLAIREDEVAAEAMGIPTTRLKVRAFVYAAFFAGIAGALFAHEVGTTLNPRELGFQKSFELVIMVVLGGMGSISGTTLAAIVLTVLPEALREFAQYRMIAYALLLIVMMLVRPQGLFGLREVWELPLFAGEEALMAGILEVEGVSLAFGGLRAVSDFRLSLPKGGLHGLIGPNGAGKTTLFNLLTGVYAPDSGTIALDGRRLNGLPPHRIAAAGLARTFQNIRLFKELTVLDNVRIAFHQRAKVSVVGALLRTPAWYGEEAAITSAAAELLALFALDGREDEAAGSLPYGDQRRLEIARALALRPKVLLLDEPAAGMNSQEKVELRSLIRRVRDEFGLTVLLIEHDMALVMDICEWITVLDHGEVIAEGTAAEVQRDPKVIEAYLGTG